MLCVETAAGPTSYQCTCKHYDRRQSCWWMGRNIIYSAWDYLSINMFLESQIIQPQSICQRPNCVESQLPRNLQQANVMQHFYQPDLVISALFSIVLGTLNWVDCLLRMESVNGCIMGSNKWSLFSLYVCILLHHSSLQFPFCSSFQVELEFSQLWGNFIDILSLL